MRSRSVGSTGQLITDGIYFGLPRARSKTDARDPKGGVVVHRGEFLLILSPVSRPGWAERYGPTVIEILEDGGYAVHARVAQGPDDTVRLAREAADRGIGVIVAGGDGSVNEIVNVLAGTEIPLGVLPFGTVNVLAQELGLPASPLRAARELAQARPVPFDLGRIGSRRFLLMASYGFDAQALRRSPPRLKRYFGRYAYALTSLALLPAYRDRPLDVYLGRADRRCGPTSRSSPTAGTTGEATSWRRTRTCTTGSWMCS